MLKKKIAVLLAAGGTSLGALTGTANAVTLPPTSLTPTSSLHDTCTLSSPDYLVSDEAMDVSIKRGSATLKATHVQPSGWWGSSYLVTGDNDEPSSWCNAYTTNKTLHLPVSLSYNPAIKANFAATAGAGVRLGFDLWLAPTTNDSTPTKLEHDKRSYEILIAPGRDSSYESDPAGHAWHRFYVTALGGTAKNTTTWGFNLSTIIADLRVPRNYDVIAVDAGGESDSGNFSVSDYYLSITYTESYTVRAYGEHVNLYEAWDGKWYNGWNTSAVKGTSTATTSAAAETTAKNWAVWTAKNDAVAYAEHASWVAWYKATYHKNP